MSRAEAINEATFAFDPGIDRQNKGTKGTNNNSGSQEAGREAFTGPLVPPTAPRVDFGPQAVARLEDRWHADEHGTLSCPIPGHTGTGRLIDQEGDLRLGCSCEGRWRSLGEVRAAEAYGFDVYRRTNISIAIWTRRLAYEIGAFDPLDVFVPLLPESASDPARHVRNGFALLVGLRWADSERRPVPYSVNFVTAWCALPRRAARESIDALKVHKVIREAGRVRRTPLYLPGALTPEAVEQFGAGPR